MAAPEVSFSALNLSVEESAYAENRARDLFQTIQQIQINQIIQQIQQQFNDSEYDLNDEKLSNNTDNYNKILYEFHVDCINLLQFADLDTIKSTENKLIETLWTKTGDISFIIKKKELEICYREKENHFMQFKFYWNNIINAVLFVIISTILFDFT